MTRDEKVLHSAHRYGAELDSPRIVSGFAARALPLGSVLVRAENGRPVPDVHAVIRSHGGWWSVDAPTPEPLAGDLWFVVLHVPGGAPSAGSCGGTGSGGDGFAWFGGDDSSGSPRVSWRGRSFLLGSPSRRFADGTT